MVKGKVIAIEAGQAIIDIGYKMEGRVELKEFALAGQDPEVHQGDTVEVFLGTTHPYERKFEEELFILLLFQIYQKVRQQRS